MNNADNLTISIIIEEVTKLERLSEKKYIRDYLNKYKYFLIESLYNISLSNKDDYEFVTLNKIIKNKINHRFDLEIAKNSSHTFRKILCNNKNLVNNII